MAIKKAPKTEKKTEEKEEQGSTEASVNAPSPVQIITVVIAVVVLGGLLMLLRSDEGYTEEARATYVSSCINSGAPEEFCGCTYDKLSSSLSYNDFKGLNERAEANQPTPEDNELVTSIAFSCVAEAQSN